MLVYPIQRTTYDWLIFGLYPQRLLLFQARVVHEVWFDLVLQRSCWLVRVVVYTHKSNILIFCCHRYGRTSVSLLLPAYTYFTRRWWSIPFPYEWINNGVPPVIEKRKINTRIKMRFQMFMTKFKVRWNKGANWGFPERGTSLTLWLVGWLVWQMGTH